jgi:hypothetical protein
MVQICPVVDFKINKKVARLNALFTLIILVLFVFSDIKYPIFILVLDFFTRAFLKGKYSIISFFSKSLLGLLKIEPEMINAGAKMFAARLGFLFCFLISIFYFFNILNAANIIALIVIVLASLEFFFDFCMGCTIYSVLRSLGF